MENTLTVKSGRLNHDKTHSFQKLLHFVFGNSSSVVMIVLQRTSLSMRALKFRGLPPVQAQSGYLWDSH